MVQGLDQSMEKCMVPTLSRWQMDPWLKATKGRPYFLIRSWRPRVSRSPIRPATSQALVRSISHRA